MYKLNNILFVVSVYLTVNGENPKEHGIKTELVSITKVWPLTASLRVELCYFGNIPVINCQKYEMI